MFSENNCDEEGKQGKGEECQSKGDEEGGVEHTLQTKNMMLDKESSMKCYERKRKEGKSYSNKEKQGLDNS